MSKTKTYFRPAGVVWGETAADLVAAGKARWLAGGPAAFTVAEHITCDGNTVRRTWLSAAEAVEAADIGLADSLTRPRAAICGLTMSRPVVMGIVNVTPDSFSDGGVNFDSGKAIAHGLALAEAGAQILDIGGESTRPGAEPVGTDEELSRVLPVVTALAGEGHVVSIDTRKGEVMRQAVAAGAAMINDVSALSHDPDAVAVAAQSGVPVVLMHSRGDPRTMQDNPVYEDVVRDVYDELEGAMERAMAGGVKADNIIVDPGIGFGKTFDHNLALLAGITMFHGLGAPLLVGASRKAFIGALSGEKEAGRRLAGSLGAMMAAVQGGAWMLRVHDVREARQCLDVWLAAVQGP